MRWMLTFSLPLPFSEPSPLLPSFSVSDHWLFSEDCAVQRFCSSPDGVMVCGNDDGREVYAVTHDIVPDKGWVMQFKVTTILYKMVEMVECVALSKNNPCSYPLDQGCSIPKHFCFLFLPIS